MKVKHERESVRTLPAETSFMCLYTPETFINRTIWALEYCSLSLLAEGQDEVCLLCQGHFKLTSAKTNMRSEWMTQRQQHGCIHRLLSHDPHRFVQSKASFDQQMLHI